MNHYPRHVGDFMRATIGLSLAERGAYSALLDQYYANEAPLPLDRRERHRMAGAVTKAECAAVDYVVGRFFVQAEDGWHNKRADEEIDAYRKRAESARVNGANGGRPPNRNKTESVISGLAKQTGSKANQEPVTSNQEIQDQHLLPKVEKIDLTADGWQGVQPEDRDKWAKAYPAVPVDIELAKARVWLESNPKHRKSNYRRFLANWFSRAQDSARPSSVIAMPQQRRVAL